MLQNQSVAQDFFPQERREIITRPYTLNACLTPKIDVGIEEKVSPLEQLSPLAGIGTT